MFRRNTLSLALIGAGLLSALASPAHAQRVDDEPNLDTLLSMVGGAMPPVIGNDNTELVGNLLGVDVGIPISRSFDFAKAKSAVFGRTAPNLQPDCGRTATPSGDPDQGECTAFVGDEKRKSPPRIHANQNVPIVVVPVLWMEIESEYCPPPRGVGVSCPFPPNWPKAAPAVPARTTPSAMTFSIDASTTPTPSDGNPTEFAPMPMSRTPHAIAGPRGETAPRPGRSAYPSAASPPRLDPFPSPEGTPARTTRHHTDHEPLQKVTPCLPGNGIRRSAHGGDE